MDPARLIPSPDTIPVHWGWFQALLTLTFILHILVMNTMLGSGILALVRELKTGSDPDPVSRDISKKLPYTIAFTVNLGVAPLLFVQVLYGQFIYTSSILMAVYWLAVIGLVIVAYYSAYLYDFKFDALGQARLIFIAVTVLILTVVALIFTNNMTLMLRPGSWGRYFTNPGGTLLNLSDPMLYPRYLHFITASVAVGGLVQALIWSLKYKSGAAHTRDHVTSGLNWFMGATCVQMVWGLWFLLSLPGSIRALFLGGSSLHTALLLLAVLGGILSLVLAARQREWQALWALLSTVTLMVFTRELLRSAFLGAWFTPANLTVTGEYSPMVLFLISLAAGLVLVVYMLRLAAAAGKEVAP
ncbi:MAG: hypothetical protein V1793_23880 [Pseudomonadota bacterium]